MTEPQVGAAPGGRALDDPSGWIGRKLDWLGGGGGRVENLLVDAETGEARWLVVRTARFGRSTAVPVELAVSAGDRVWVPLERELIRAAGDADAAGGLDPAAELALCDHYGVPAGARRRGEIEPLTAEQLSAVPVRTTG